ncbi:DUF192 domain-containing protein [Candidatus Micrarchaeota archaeon]|nr:DUF192 domain-containing protein [Candidatus Micrarchaeota archaeon]
MFRKKTKMMIKVDRIASDIFSQLRGLMFRRRPISILFKFKKEDVYPIHSWFVFFKFDLLFLNKDYVILEIYKNVPCFSYIKPKNKARYILELPPGYVDKFEIKKGDKIRVRVR